MSDESPAVAPAPAAAPSGFNLTTSHVMTGGALSGLGVGGYELFSPLVHWAVTGGAPDADAQKSLSLIATLAAGALVAFVKQYLNRKNGASNA